MILAEQEQPLRTNAIKSNIDKCGICGEKSDTVMHLISGCKKLAGGSTNGDMIGLQRECAGSYASMG